VTNTINEREIALDILMEVNEKEQYIHVLLNDALRKYQYLEKNERAFISRLVKGTMERRLTLDYVINQVSSVRVNKMKPLIRNLMRMSVYQMMYMEQVPVSAVCNEAVKLAKKRKFTNLSGFVNGVLRNISRQLPQIKLPDDLSIKYSVPQELVSVLEASYGRETVELIFESFLKENKVSAITNTVKITKKELVNRLKSQGITVEDAPYVEDAFILSDYNYLDDIEEFSAGMFQIQDISSMLAGVIASPAKDSTVLDVCAAPGGKSIFAALMMSGTGHVISRDVSERKTGQIEENVERLGLSNIDVEVSDAAVHNIEDEDMADMLIADLPCSGIGIIGRKPDIKYNVSRDKIEGIIQLQRKILDSIYSDVKHGGYIVYSTCTLNSQENEENVRYIKSKGFEAVDITASLPEKLIDDAKRAGKHYYDKLIKDAADGMLTLIPGVYECDGFFVAKLKRI
jgi:16S rRNA (cytosine967-C5)-methyltransferase